MVRGELGGMLRAGGDEIVIALLVMIRLAVYHNIQGAAEDDSELIAVRMFPNLNRLLAFEDRNEDMLVLNQPAVQTLYFYIRLRKTSDKLWKEFIFHLFILRPSKRLFISIICKAHSTLKDLLSHQFLA